MILAHQYPPSASHAGRPRRVRQHFATTGATSTQIRAFASNLERDIERRQIKIVRGRGVDNRPGFDENALRDEVATRVQGRDSRDSKGFDRDSATDFDVRALIAVAAARGGGAGDTFESAGAVLVTSSGSLVGVANGFPGLRARGYDLAMSVHKFLSLMWLRNPAELADVPAGRLAMECAALMTPGSEHWSQYTRAVRALREAGELSDGDVAAALYDIEARSDVALAEARGVEMDNETVKRQLERRAAEREAALHAAEAQRDSVTGGFETLRQRHDALKATEHATNERLRRAAKGVGTSALVLIIALPAAALWQYFWAQGAESGPAVRIVATVILVGVDVAFVWKAAAPVREWVRQRFLALFGHVFRRTISDT